MRNWDLILVGIPAGMVGVVADEARIEVVEEGVRAEVECDAQNGHVVGVHHPVAEAIGLPSGDHFCGALQHFTEEAMVWLWMLQAFGKVAFDNMIKQLLQFVVLLGVVEEFKVAEADVAGREAHQHCAALLAFAVDRCLRTGHAERAGAGNTQRVQVLAGKKLAD